MLEKTKNAVKKKLSRLYELYSEGDDDILIEEINRRKRELSEIDEKIRSEKENRSVSLASEKQLKKLGALQSAWNTMSLEEKQSVLRELIDKIVITYETVEIFYSGNIK